MRSPHLPGPVAALAVLGLLLACHPPLAAQDSGLITGTVRADFTLRPLAGAQVFVQGTQVGALTNADGAYRITGVRAGTHQVRVILLGYAGGSQTVTVTSGQTATADFTLAETAISLEGLVVTGTAKEVRAREVGSALDAVIGRELESAPVTNPENILGGRVPGLTVLQGAGQPGAATTVRIRAQTTVSSTTDPLIYVDGIRIFHLSVGIAGARVGISPLQDIAAEDIERIEVIKGASAATLYGTEASGGVIQIFTKRGISGAPIWNAEVTGGFNNQPRLGIAGDPWEMFTRCAGEMYGISVTPATLGQEVKFMDPTCPGSGRWFKNGPVQRYSLSVRGGTGGVGYFVSLNYNDEDGTLPTQNAKLGGLRANLDFTPAEGLKVQVNSALSMRELTFMEDGNSMYGFLLNATRGHAGNYKGGKGRDCAEVPSGTTCVTNKYVWIDQHDRTRTDRFTTGLTIQHDATESLTNRLAVGWDFDQLNTKRLLDWGAVLTPLGTYANFITHHTKLSMDYAGTFTNAFGDEVNSTLSWGGQLFRDQHRLTALGTQDFAGPGVPTLSSGGRAPGQPTDLPVTQTNAGFFLQELIGWKDLLFLTLGVRVDGNSAFGDDFGLQPYPKASVAYVVSDHDFWPVGWWETMKLRAAFGYSGRAPDAFAKVRTWSPISNDGSPGFTPGDVGNPEVGPERTRELEVGFDASVGQGRLGLEATYYNAKTTDALVGVLLPVSDGFTTNRTENVGTLMAEGLELQVNGALYRSDLLEWRAQANLAFSRSEALDLNCRDLDGNAANGKEACEQITVYNGAEIRVGHPVPTYWRHQVLNPDEHAPPIPSDTLLPVGPVYPTRLLGFSTSLSLGKHVTVEALLEHQGGHYLPNGTGHGNAFRGAWYPCYEIQKAMAQARATGDQSLLSPYTALERARCAPNVQGASYPAADPCFWTDKADFWKLRSVSVTVQLPDAWVRRYADRATLTVAGRNLLKWTDYEGTDPEVEDFVDRAWYTTGAGSYGRREYYNLPPSRSFLATLRVTF